MLKKLDDEKILLSNRQRLPKLEEAFPSDDTKEIFEAYNEEAEAEWRRMYHSLNTLPQIFQCISY